MEQTICEKLYNFINCYWQYYLKLENDLLITENYLTIHNENKKAFSIAYLQLYLSIGSEIDVLAKEISKEIDSSFKGEEIQEYCKTITGYIPNITKEKISIIYRDFDTIVPWTPWDFEEGVNKKGKKYIKSKDTPKWWKSYNKIKHNRTSYVSNRDNSEKKYYQLADQENIISALAGLYVLEMYYYTELLKKYKNSHGRPIDKFDNLWLNKSKLFGLKSLMTNRFLGESTFNNCSFYFCENY